MEKSIESGIYVWMLYLDFGGGGGGGGPIFHVACELVQNVFFIVMSKYAEASLNDNCWLTYLLLNIFDDWKILYFVLKETL